MLDGSGAELQLMAEAGEARTHRRCHRSLEALRHQPLYVRATRHPQVTREPGIMRNRARTTASRIHYSTIIRKKGF